MSATLAATTFRVEDARRLGNVVLMARAGRVEMEMARGMAAALAEVEPSSASDLLEHLRQAFPNVPLNVRVAALGFLMENQRLALAS